VERSAFRGGARRETNTRRSNWSFFTPAGANGFKKKSFQIKKRQNQAKNN